MKFIHLDTENKEIALKISWKHYKIETEVNLFLAVWEPQRRRRHSLSWIVHKIQATLTGCLKNTHDEVKLKRLLEQRQ